MITSSSWDFSLNLKDALKAETESVMKGKSSKMKLVLCYVTLYSNNLLKVCESICHVHGTFNKIPDFFEQAFKIVVDSWKFTMLLLYILWDDWLIFMISGSKEQLQQELEYTLLNPDCRSWWISKMQFGCEDTLEEQYAIKFCFKLGKMPQKRMDASDCFWTILHESSISFWVA